MSAAPDMFATYESMLKLVGMEATSEGFVRMEAEEGEYVSVTGKDNQLVVLPKDERLRDRNVDNYQIFHLLRDTGAKDSDLMARYRHWVINRFNIVLGGLGEVLLKILASKDHTKRLSPEQLGFMELVEAADQETIDTWSNLADVTCKPNQIARVFLSLYLRPAAVLKGKSYNRVAVVNFPFYDELLKVDREAEAYKTAPKGKKGEKPETRVFDVEIRVKDRKPLLGLMRYLLPELDVEHKYDAGSNSRIAPGLDAMMRAVLHLAGHLNGIMDLFMKVDPGLDRSLEQMKFNLDWAEAFDNLDALWPQIRNIPQQGTSVIEEPKPVDPRSGAAPAAPNAYQPTVAYGAPAHAPWQPPPPPATQYTPPGQPYGQPYGAPPPAQPARASGSGMSVQDMMAGLAGGRSAQPTPYHGGYQAPAPAQGGYQSYPAPANYPPAGPKRY